VSGGPSTSTTTVSVPGASSSQLSGSLYNNNFPVLPPATMSYLHHQAMDSACINIGGVTSYPQLPTACLPTQCNLSPLSALEYGVPMQIQLPVIVILSPVAVYTILNLLM